MSAQDCECKEDAANRSVVAIKDMSAGNDTVGEMWKETKIFKGTDTLNDVLMWGGIHKQISITLPDGEELPK